MKITEIPGASTIIHCEPPSTRSTLEQIGQLKVLGEVNNLSLGHNTLIN